MVPWCTKPAQLKRMSGAPISRAACATVLVVQHVEPAGLDAGRAGEFRELRVVDVGRDHAGTFACEGERRGPADSLCCSGHYRGLAGESSSHDVHSRSACAKGPEYATGLRAAAARAGLPRGTPGSRREIASTRPFGMPGDIIRDLKTRAQDTDLREIEAVPIPDRSPFRRTLENAMLQAADLIIRLNAADDVVIARVDLPAGTEIAKENIRTATAVPAGHKIATHDIKEGEPVRRYNQIIGFATRPIRTPASMSTCTTSAWAPSSATTRSAPTTVRPTSSPTPRCSRATTAPTAASRRATTSACCRA
jgi:hypothetical protein